MTERTRLALAKTLVSGTVTLQGISYSFTASASGTATEDNIPEAKKLAVAASNAAATAAARASIDKILADNSDVLSDLEITSLIYNNLSTTVVVFRPIDLKQSASSTDGVNYTLNKNLIIGAEDWLTVRNGLTLSTGKYTVTNFGYFQVGEPSRLDTTTLKGTEYAKAEYNKDFINHGTVEICKGSSCTIDAGVTFSNIENYKSYLNNYGICYNYGNIINSGAGAQIMVLDGGIFTNKSGAIITNSNNWYANVTNWGTFTNEEGATITNSYEFTYVKNFAGTFTNYGTITNSAISDLGYASSIYNYDLFINTNTGTITNSGSSSYVGNYQGSIFNNAGTITNSGIASFLTSDGTITNNGNDPINGNQGLINGSSAEFNNTGTITNSGTDSYVINKIGSTFTNDGTINNTGTGSSTTNSGTWNGTGTCSGTS